MNRGRLVLPGVIAIVAAAVVAGLYVSGSPIEQRRFRADERRVNDIQQISNTIGRYYNATENLPPELETLVNGWASTGIPRDPETENEYRYEITSDDSYRLCAEFARDSRPNRERDFWRHGGGSHCYSFDYSELVLD
jgi:hypothetical protein